MQTLPQAILFCWSITPHKALTILALSALVVIALFIGFMLKARGQLVFHRQVKPHNDLNKGYLKDADEWMNN